MCCLPVVVVVMCVRAVELLPPAAAIASHAPAVDCPAAAAVVSVVVGGRDAGHFWKCPNGDGCIYRHRLPQGFVFRPKGQKMEEEIEDEVPLEEQIEEARAKLDPDKCTPVTEASFKAWLAKQEQKKKEEVEKVRKKAAKKGGNRGIHALSGHALFQFDQSLFQQQLNDDEAVAEYKISEIDNRDTDDEEEEPKQASSKSVFPLSGTHFSELFIIVIHVVVAVSVAAAVDGMSQEEEE